MNDALGGLLPSSYPASVIPQLEHWLHYESGEVGSAAAKALISLGDSGKAVLLSALEDADGTVVLRAINALGMEDSPQFIAAAMRLLQDENPDLRAGAVKVLGTTRNVHVLQSIFMALDDPHGMVGRVAIETLGQFKDDPAAQERLLSLLRNCFETVLKG